jgi:DNA repair ATPase RecN
MMKTLINKVLGFSLLFAALVGLAVSLAGLILTVQVQEQVATSLTGILDLLDRTLTTTESGFAMADSAMNDAIDALESLQTTVDSVEAVMESTLPTLESISELVGEKLPNTIRSTRRALTTAQTAAKNVDNFLATLSGLPLIGKAIYNPETPLNQTIGSVSDSLKDTPEMLSSSQESLDQMSDSLGDIQAEMKGVSGNVRSITASALEAQRVLREYQAAISDLHREVERIQDRLPTWLRLATIGTILLFVWLALAQVAIAMQGLELLARGKPGKVEAVIPPTESPQ